MDEQAMIEELTDLETAFLDSVIRIADKYKQNREELLEHAVATLYIAIRTANFTNYVCKEEGAKNE